VLYYKECLFCNELFFVFIYLFIISVMCVWSDWQSMISLLGVLMLFAWLALRAARLWVVWFVMLVVLCCSVPSLPKLLHKICDFWLAEQRQWWPEWSTLHLMCMAWSHELHCHVIYVLTRSSAVAERPHDASMLRVIEYFAKSLKIIQNDTVEQGVCKSLLVFHLTMYLVPFLRYLASNNGVTLQFC